MLTNEVKILLALFLLLILTGCSPTGSKENLIRKKSVTVTLSEGTSTGVEQLSNGTYIYHDKAYPGL